MSEPRYIVRESYGVPVRFALGAKDVTEVMVMDTWYCYAVVWDSFRDTTLHLGRARLRAHRLCAQWNAEHDAALASEDAQARNGTVSC